MIGESRNSSKWRSPINNLWRKKKCVSLFRRTAEKETYRRFHFEVKLRLELSITYGTLLCYSVKQKIICCRLGLVHISKIRLDYHVVMLAVARLSLGVSLSLQKHSKHFLVWLIPLSIAHYLFWSTCKNNGRQWPMQQDLPASHLPFKLDWTTSTSGTTRLSTLTFILCVSVNRYLFK